MWVQFRQNGGKTGDDGARTDVPLYRVKLQKTVGGT